MRELVEAFFRERSIVNHHIASFNDFLTTPDNLNSGMQRVVDNIRIGDTEEERGLIRLEIDKTGGETVEIRIGRKRNPKTGAIERNARSTIFVDMPQVKEANGATNPLTPMEARLRNLNYQAAIYLECTVVENGVDKEPEKVHIGNLPVMVKSKKCNIHQDNIDSEVELSREEHKKKLIELGEDPLDSGGYFIIGGTERSLISLEDLAPNRVMVEFNERYGHKIEVAKVFSQKEGYRALTLVEKKRDGMLMVSVPSASGQIPLVVLMKALDMESDEAIFESIVSDPEMANIVYAKK